MKIRDLGGAALALVIVVAACGSDGGAQSSRQGTVGDSAQGGNLQPGATTATPPTETVEQGAATQPSNAPEQVQDDVTLTCDGVTMDRLWFCPSEPLPGFVGNGATGTSPNASWAAAVEAVLAGGVFGDLFVDTEIDGRAAVTGARIQDAVVSDDYLNVTCDDTGPSQLLGEDLTNEIVSDVTMEIRGSPGRYCETYTPNTTVLGNRTQQWKWVEMTPGGKERVAMVTIISSLRTEPDGAEPGPAVDSDAVVAVINGWETGSPCQQSTGPVNWVFGDTGCD